MADDNGLPSIKKKQASNIRSSTSRGSAFPQSTTFYSPTSFMTKAQQHRQHTRQCSQLAVAISGLLAKGATSSAEGGGGGGAHEGQGRTPTSSSRAHAASAPPGSSIDQSLNPNFMGMGPHIHSEIPSFFDVWPANNAHRAKRAARDAPHAPPLNPKVSTFSPSLATYADTANPPPRPTHTPTTLNRSGSASSDQMMSTTPIPMALFSYDPALGPKPRLVADIEAYITEQLALLAKEMAQANYRPISGGGTQTPPSRSSSSSPKARKTAPTTAGTSSPPSSPLGFSSTMAASPSSAASKHGKKSGNAAKPKPSAAPKTTPAAVGKQANKDSPVQHQPVSPTAPVTEPLAELFLGPSAGSSSALAQASPLPTVSPPASPLMSPAMTSLATEQQQRLSAKEMASEAHRIQLRSHRLRLNVFRQAGRMFGSAFRSYEPVLETILSEYDSCISFQDEAFARLSEVVDEHKVNMQTVQAQNQVREAKLQASLKTTKQQLHASERHAQALQREFDKTKTALDELSERMGCTAEEELESRNNNAVLVHKIRQLEMDQELFDMERQEWEKKYQRMLAHWDEDKVKIAEVTRMLEHLYEEKRKDEAIIQDLMEQKRLLKKQYNEDLMDMRRLKAEHKKQEQLILDLTKQLKDTKAELQVIRDELDELKSRALTPRPEWSVVPTVADPATCSSKLEVQKLSVMYQEMTLELEKVKGENCDYQLFVSCAKQLHKAVEAVNQPKYFVPLGKGNEIVKFLRLPKDVKVRNRKLTQRDALFTLRDFFAARAKQMLKPGQVEFYTSTAGDYLYDWLQLKYGIKNVLMEWSYSLEFALRNMPTESIAVLGLAVLNDQMPEAMWHEMDSMVNPLRAAFEAFDIVTNPLTAELSHELARTEYLTAVKEVFKYKTDERFLRLLIAMKGATYGQGGEGTFETLRYPTLFETDDNCCDSEFVKELRRQFMEEHEEWVTDVQLFAMRRKLAEAAKAKALAEAEARGEPPPPPSSPKHDKTVKEMIISFSEGYGKDRVAHVEEEQLTARALKKKQEEEEAEQKAINEALNQTTVTPAFMGALLTEYDEGLQRADLVAILCRGFQCNTANLFPGNAAQLAPDVPNYFPLSSTALMPPNSTTLSPASPLSPSIAATSFDPTSASSPLTDSPTDSPTKAGTQPTTPMTNVAGAARVTLGPFVWGDPRRDKGENRRRGSFDALVHGGAVPFLDTPESAVSLIAFMDRMRYSVVRRYSPKMIDPFTKRPVPHSKFEKLLDISGILGPRPPPGTGPFVDRAKQYRQWLGAASAAETTKHAKTFRMAGITPTPPATSTTQPRF